MPATPLPVSEHLKQVPPAIRPIVQAARRTVKVVAPGADEISYHGGPPSSSRTMWKLVRYAANGANVAGIGIYPTYAAMFFYRGRELDDALLQGGGKDMRFIRLKSAEDAERPAIRRLLRKAFRLAGSG